VEQYACYCRSTINAHARPTEYGSHDSTITREDLRLFLRKSSSLIVSVAQNRLHVDVQDIEQWQARFESMKRLYGMSDTGGAVVGRFYYCLSVPSFNCGLALPRTLSKAISALKDMPPDDDNGLLHEVLQALTFVTGMDALYDDVEADSGRTRLADKLARFEAASGTEQWEGMDSRTVAVEAFGLTNGEDGVRGLNEFVAIHDDLAGLSPHSSQWKEAFAHSRTTGDTSSFKPLKMSLEQWHGAAAIIDAALNGRPLLVTDEVGTGKTGQLLFAYLLLAHFRFFRKEYGCFPGHEHSIHPFIIRCLFFADALAREHQVHA
jgi:hypothetical protein